MLYIDVRDCARRMIRRHGRLHNRKITMAWAKGQSGNPNGAPKKSERAITFLKMYLSEEELAEKISLGVKALDMNMVKLACEYMWGKPVQPTDNTNTHNFPQGIDIKFTRPRAVIEEPVSDTACSNASNG